MVFMALFFASFPVLCLGHGFPVDTLSRDVCIVGGGSAGTYAAIRLLDSNQTVIVVEQQDRLGGNTQTFIDPVTGAPIDIGVVVWHNNTLVSNYFQRLNVSLVSINELDSPFVTIYPDFQTGQLVAGYTPAIHRVPCKDTSNSCLNTRSSTMDSISLILFRRTF